MTDPLLRAALWLHPALGLATIGLAVRQASLGLRIRRGGAAAGPARAQHRRGGPWLLALVIVNWLAGLASVWIDPREMEVAASGHSQVGSMLVVLYGLAALAARRIDGDPRARRLHPWIGAAALLLSGVQLFLGLQLMPL